MGRDFDVGVICTADMVLHDMILTISVMNIHERMKRNGNRRKARGIERKARRRYTAEDL